MPAFPEFTDAQLEAVQHYVRQKARADLRAAK
jgi:mono/diheme cytochrome c family protein